MDSKIRSWLNVFFLQTIKSVSLILVWKITVYRETFIPFTLVSRWIKHWAIHARKTILSGWIQDREKPFASERSAKKYSVKITLQTVSDKQVSFYHLHRPCQTSSPWVCASERSAKNYTVTYSVKKTLHAYSKR